MRIEVFAVCYNEEKILPYFLRHYSQFAEIYLYDNYSTDKSVEIAQRAGAHVMMFDTQGQFDDGKNLEIKENCWHDSKADWVIVIDCDEFVYHTNLPEYLSEVKATVIEPHTFEMFTDKFPTTEGQIYEEVKNGHPSWPKKNIFKPTEITRMNYIAGCHLANPEGNVIILTTLDIKTLHMKHLGRQYTIDRNILYGGRISQRNIEMKWGTHLLRLPEQVGADYDRLIQIVKPVI
jgi:glycosyltransferase involved in cell wall biosynthesis